MNEIVDQLNGSFQDNFAACPNPAFTVAIGDVLVVTDTDATEGQPTLVKATQDYDPRQTVGVIEARTYDPAGTNTDVLVTTNGIGSVRMRGNVNPAVGERLRTVSGEVFARSGPTGPILPLSTVVGAAEDDEIVIRGVFGYARTTNVLVKKVSGTNPYTVITCDRGGNTLTGAANLANVANFWEGAGANTWPVSTPVELLVDSDGALCFQFRPVTAPTAGYDFITSDGYATFDTATTLKISATQAQSHHHLGNSYNYEAWIHMPAFTVPANATYATILWYSSSSSGAYTTAGSSSVQWTTTLDWITAGWNPATVAWGTRPATAATGAGTITRFLQNLDHYLDASGATGINPNHCVRVTVTPGTTYYGFRVNVPVPYVLAGSFTNYWSSIAYDDATYPAYVFFGK